MCRDGEWMVEKWSSAEVEGSDVQGDGVDRWGMLIEESDAE